MPPPGGFTRIARLLLVATPFLFALLAPPALEAQKQAEHKKAAEQRRAPSAHVEVGAAPTRPCPNISLCCHASVRRGLLGPFAATLGETGGVTPTFAWKVSAGQVAEGQGTKEILIDTKGLRRGTVLATVEVGGYGPRCSATCVAQLPDVNPRPASLAALRVSVKSSPDGRPVPHAKINVYPADGGAPGGQIETDARGRFERGGWTPGTYRLEVIAHRFEKRESDVTLGASSAGAVVLSLKPIAAPPTPTPSPTPSPSPTPTPSPTATPSPSPAPALRSKNLTANVVKGTGLPLFALTVLAALAAAGYFLLNRTAGGAPAGGDTVAAPAEAPADAAAGTTRESDEVHCTVFSPTQAAPGDAFQVQVFAHLAEQRSRLAAEAAMADDTASERKGVALSRAVERGAELTFKLQVYGLEVPEPEQSLVWDGPVEPPQCVQFVVLVPDDCKPKNTSGVVKVFYEGAPVGQVIFQIKVAEAGAPVPAAPTPLPPPQKEIRYRKAFISYCSKDRANVLRELQGLEAAYNRFGVTYFMDVDDLRTGEDWRDVIEKNLDESDLFVLFWSSAAKESKEVLREVEYAFARKGGREDTPPFFEPIPIELPIPMPLPKGLEPIHFNDRKLLMRKGQEVVDAELAARTAQTEAAPSQA